MAEFDKTNTGTLGKNDRREKETHPEYTGSGNYQGQEFWISAWVKESKDGRKFFSISFRPKESKSVLKRHEAQKANAFQPDAEFFDDKIPF